jgi:hypothetical protein
MVAGKLWIFWGFDVYFASFSVWNLAFLRNVWAFHFCKPLQGTLTTLVLRLFKILCAPICASDSNIEKWPKCSKTYNLFLSTYKYGFSTFWVSLAAPRLKYWKMAQKFKNSQFFKFFFKSFKPNDALIPCPTRLQNALEKKISFDGHLWQHFMLNF